MRIIRNIQTHKRSSILAVLISLLLILFMFLYLGGLSASQSELANLPYAVPVEGKIVNPNGSWDTELQISASIVQKLERTEMIKGVIKTANFYVDDTMTVYEEDEQDWLGFNTLLGSVNTLEAFPYIDASEVEFAEGYTPDFTASNEAVCILESEYMNEKNLQIGDTYEASVYRKRYEYSALMYSLRYVANIELEIIGSFEIDYSKVGSAETVIAVAPIRYVREVFRDADAPYGVHSMHFAWAGDGDLDDFKAAAEEIGLKPRNPQDGLEVAGRALVLYDEAYIKTESQLMKSISLRQILLPLIFAVISAIGFLTSYLLLQSRQNEFAIMRSLGQSKASVFFSLLLEAVILALIGGLAGSIIGIIIGTDLLTALVILGIFIILYSLGTVIALLLLNRFSVMEVLTKADE